MKLGMYIMLIPIVCMEDLSFCFCGQFQFSWCSQVFNGLEYLHIVYVGCRLPYGSWSKEYFPLLDIQRQAKGIIAL